MREAEQIMKVDPLFQEARYDFHTGTFQYDASAVMTLGTIWNAPLLTATLDCPSYHSNNRVGERLRSSYRVWTDALAPVMNFTKRFAFNDCSLALVGPG